MDKKSSLYKNKDPTKINILVEEMNTAKINFKNELKKKTIESQKNFVENNLGPNP